MSCPREFCVLRTGEVTTILETALGTLPLALRSPRNRYCRPGAWAPPRALRNEGVHDCCCRGLSSCRLVLQGRAWKSTQGCSIRDLPRGSSALIRTVKVGFTSLHSLVVSESTTISQAGLMEQPPTKSTTPPTLASRRPSLPPGENPRPVQTAAARTPSDTRPVA
jgi:hypothetical protein